MTSEPEATSDPEYSVLDLHGRRRAMLSWGAAGAPLMLMLHGFPDTAWTWRRVAPLIAAEGWRVVAPFSRGYAPSDLADDGNYQLGALVSDVMDLYDALDADARTVLVGHDWGAMTAYGVGALSPARFARVVTLSVAPHATLQRAMRESGVGLALRQLRCSWYILFNQLPGVAERTFVPLVRRLWADWSPGLDASFELDQLLRALPTREHRAAAVGYYRALLQPWRRLDVYAEYQRACEAVPTMPTLFMHGTKDGALLPEFATGAITDLTAGSRLVMIDGAGHFPQLERPELVADEILSFLERSRSEG